MSETKISWTNRVWNPYDKLKLPNWKTPQRIFVNSMSDLFHEDVSFEFLKEVYANMALRQKHIFQVLTKRPENMKTFYEKMLEYIKTWDMGDCIPPWFRNNCQNIWLGVTAENQAAADRRIPILLKTPAAIRWVNLEPMLERIDLAQCYYEGMTMVDSLYGKYGVFELYHNTNNHEWVVVGCESGINRRPCRLEWIESIVEQCQSAGVPVFVKQIEINGKVIKDINKFPEHLRTQEFPR